METANTIRERLAALRAWMRTQGIDAFIVPSNDPHFSEYVAPHWGCRAWISGFDGSAGTVVVTAEQAALWTDSRYFLQAEAQLQGTGIELQRLALPDTPTIPEWLNAVQAARVGVDGLLFSKSAFDRLQQELGGFGITLSSTEDPFDTIWTDRPALPKQPARLLAPEYSGETALSKQERIRAAQPDGAVRLIAVLDEIAWTLNLRGRDIEYNPLTVSYLAIEPSQSLLFIDRDKLTPADREQLLLKAGVAIRPYDEFAEYLASLSNRPVIANPNGLDIRHWNILEQAGARLQPETTPYGLVTALKAVKNPTEIAGFRRAMETDGVALVRFEMWLESSLSNGEHPTELEIATRLHAYRAAGEGFQGESFETISGYGTHGAIVHYSATPESDIPAGQESFLLIDSGGQYLYGTTDITRTYHFGRPTAEQRRDYTAVLRGMIDLSAARFPVGTRGAQLDVLARRYLWEIGQNYLHGTGHGIGHFLCVHEGPQSIRMNENPVLLEPGMVQSCEPGLYLAGKHGIRIENLTLVTTEGCPEGFLRFEPLTLCPISLTAVDVDSLDSAQREWLNAYHAEVYRRLSPHLTPDEQRWLQTKTCPI